MDTDERIIALPNSFSKILMLIMPSGYALRLRRRYGFLVTNKLKCNGRENG